MENNLKDIKGLSSREVEERLKTDGYNEIPAQGKRGFFAIFVEVLKEPMLLILVAAGAIYFFLGEPRDALMLSVFVAFIVGITFYQQRKTERALESLRDLSSPRALVIRDGAPRRIAGREVVVGDILVLREGDRVAADSAVLESVNLMVDESLLTGESLAVAKSIWDGKEDAAAHRPGGDSQLFIYSGTLITRGHGLARVLTIGAVTEMGKIGKSLQGIKEGETLLSKETGRLARIFGIIGLSLCFLAVVFRYLSSNELLQSILYGLTIGMSMLPEEFPVVMLVFLALGAWRISKRKVLTRNACAIEALGATNILCVDKTGTLTLNQMRLQELSSGVANIDLAEYESGEKDLPDHFKKLLEYAMLASQSDPFDPLEKEIKRTGDSFLFSVNRLQESWKLVKEYPFAGNLLALSHVWEPGDGDRYVVAAKGAPESIIDLCHLSGAKKAAVEERMKPLLEKGLRLIAVAAASAEKTKLPDCGQHDFDFEFVGLLGFCDPIRPSAARAIKECYDAGIRVCMITGDYPGTAQHAARAVGLKNPDEYLTGDDLGSFSHEQLYKRLKTVNIFARVAPEQKMLIINAFKEGGVVIAMTGDGVNDAPALKSANVGIAMAERGTDVAREAADLVLLNDDFASIVAAVRMGRTVFDNIKKAISYIFAVHIPIAGMSFLPVALGMPVVFYPAHIAFLELVIDPACSVAFEAEPEDENVMSRPPRKLDEPLFGRKEILRSLMQGLGVLAAVFLVFLFAIWSGRSEGQTRALAFLTIVIANLSLIIANLSSGNPFKVFANGNKAFRFIFLATLITLTLVLCVPALRSVFHFDPIAASDIIPAIAAAVLGAFWLAPLKIFFKRKS
jgi:Ca2+-transporting ATPase